MSSPVAPAGRRQVPVRVEVRTDLDGLEDLATAWDDLLLRSAEPSAYHARGWVGAWWRAFGADRAWPGGGARLHVVAAWRGPLLVALHPLLQVELGAGPAAVRMLVGIGAENADYGGPLVEAGDAEAAAALADHLLAAVDERRTVVNLTRLVDAHPLLRALEVRREPLRHRLASEEEVLYPYLDLDVADPERLVAALVRRNDVRRRSRRLAEQGEVTWVAHHPDAGGAGIESFFRLHEQRWEGRRASGPYADERGRRFIADAVQGLDRQGLLRLAELRLDGVPIAGRVGAEVGGWYQGMKSGWDPSYARFGLGHLMVGRILEDAARRRLHGFDFLRGAADHKSAWTQTTRRVGYWTLGRNGRATSLERRAMWAMLRLRYRARAGNA